MDYLSDYISLFNGYHFYFLLIYVIIYTYLMLKSEDLVILQEKNISKCGLYAKGMKNNHQVPINKNVLLPLRHIEYNIEIVNSLVSVTLVQKYQNATHQFLELQYSFPISPNACIYRFVAKFGDKIIQGTIKQLESARREYQAAKKEGKQVAIGQIDKFSKDIMNLTIGNVEPKAMVQIRISYLQQLSISVNTFYRLQIFAKISPRYMNSIPNEDLRKSFRKVHQTPKGNFFWDFTITLKTSKAVKLFDSLSHDIILTEQNSQATQSHFSFDKQYRPLKDFVFVYTTEDFHLPSYVLGRTDKASTAMLSFIPKFSELKIDDAYKAIVENRHIEADMDSAKGEYIFLLDRSGSMEGVRIKKAIEALTLFIKSLPEDTYFNVISFGSRFKVLFKQSKKYTNGNAKESIGMIKNMDADMGGTEIYDPLKHVLKQQIIPGYPKHVFLLTDGDVSNTEGVIKMVANSTKYARVHCIGIGDSCSQALITGCAEKGKGSHIFITDAENPSKKIIQLLQDSLSPVITQLKLSYDKEIVESIIPNPESIPYVLKNEPVNFYVNFKGQLDHKTKFTMSYEDSQNHMNYEATLELDSESPSESFVEKMGHFKKIRALEDTFNNEGSKIIDYLYFVKNVDTKKEIIQESINSQVLSQFTAFLCVGKQLVDGKYQEFLEKGSLEIEPEKKPYYQSSDDDDEMYGNQQCCIMPSSRQQHDEDQDQMEGNEECCFISSSVVKKDHLMMESQEDSSMIEQRHEPINNDKKSQSTSIIDQVIEVIEFIQTDGSCSQESILVTLFPKFVKEIHEYLQKSHEKTALITYFISKWIEKNYPSEEEYNMIVRKSKNWLKKKSPEFVKNHEHQLQHFFL